VFIGNSAGSSQTTGGACTYVGPSAGTSMTTGAKNTILGGYSGNQGGLDIRTSSNVVVLSDGDGNPVMQVESTGYTVIGYGTRGADGGLLLMGSTTSGQGPCVTGFTGAYGARTAKWYAGSNSYVKGGTTYDTYTVMAGSSGGVNLTSGATSWASASDERLKDIIEPITDAATKVSTLRAVIGKYKTDAEGTRRSFLIAQDVQAVLPEAVSEGRETKDDDTAYLQVAYTDVIPLLVAAIKELKAEFDAYKASHP
jgi:flagellin-like hook-associated protein FlgL